MNTTNRKRQSKQQAGELDAALRQLQELVDLTEADELQPSSAQTVYTTSVVLWLLVLQRLDRGCSMAAAVKQLLPASEDLLPANKRIEQGTLSSSTAAYSDGRRRLSLETVMWLANAVWQSLVNTTSPTWHGRRVFALDGTTLALPPEWELRESFPPATNQYGESAWPIAYLVVAHEVESGAALPPEIGAMYGENAVSETNLIHDHLRRIPDGSIVLADSSYGITRVAHAMVEADKRFVLRMKKDRFRRLQKAAVLVAQGEGWKTYEGYWKPSRRELKENPQLPADLQISVRLHKFETEQGEVIYLATDLPEGIDQIAELYGHRWSVETDLSHLKVTLDVENIRAKSPDMFRKELMTSMVAYNLTIQFRRQAAAKAKLPPRRLSFKGVWDVFRIFLLRSNYPRTADWESIYERALNMAAKEKLPNRPGRSYPREAYKRRPKSQHFQKRIPPWNQHQNNPN